MDKPDYLQCPVDYLESFSWVAQWAFLFNVDSKRASPLEKRWQHEVASQSFECNMVSYKIFMLQRDQLAKLSPTYQGWHPILKEWYYRAGKLR